MEVRPEHESGIQMLLMHLSTAVPVPTTDGAAAPASLLLRRLSCSCLSPAILVTALSFLHSHPFRLPFPTKRPKVVRDSSLHFSVDTSFSCSFAEAHTCKS